MILIDRNQKEMDLLEEYDLNPGRYKKLLEEDFSTEQNIIDMYLMIYSSIYRKDIKMLGPNRADELMDHAEARLNDLVEKRTPYTFRFRRFSKTDDTELE